MTIKLTALQGFLIVIVILGVIGGALQLVASELVQNPDVIAWMGAYQVPLLAFLKNSWIVIIVTFIYNIFMYIRQNQLAALNKTVEMFQLQKFTATLAWFVGILGPMAALVNDKQLQGIISLIIVVITALISEFKNLQSNETILQPVTTLPPESSGSSNTPNPTTSTPPPASDTGPPQLPIITYGPWIQTVTVTTSAYGPAGTTLWTRDVYTNGSFTSQQVQTTKPTG